MRKKVLVTLDDSTFSLRILPQVTELFAAHEYDIVLLHVATLPGAVVIDEQVVVYADQATASRQAEGIAAMQPYVRGLEELGYRVTPMVRFGEPATQIANVAATMNFDVIAMATHGRTGIDRVLHGSVAQDVVSRVGLPVLLFHAEAELATSSAHHA